MSERPLLMIPGPIEVSESVRAAAAEAPRSHVAPDFIEAFGASLEAMRKVWLAADSAQPFIVAGSGTLAMEMAAWNVVAPGERVVVVNTGYFSDRAEEMLRRRGAEVAPVNAEPGHVPSMDEVRSAVVAGPTRALFATHVDTSTGVRVDARGLCQLALRGLCHVPAQSMLRLGRFCDKPRAPPKIGRRRRGDYCNAQSTRALRKRCFRIRAGPRPVTGLSML